MSILDPDEPTRLAGAKVCLQEADYAIRAAHHRSAGSGLWISGRLTVLRKYLNETIRIIDNHVANLAAGKGKP